MRNVSLLSYSAFAVDYRWTGVVGDGDWANVQNYNVGGAIPSALPGAEDTVTIPDNATVRLEYDAADESKKRSCEVFGGVGRIIPEGVNAVIDVTVPMDSRLELGCAIVGSFSEPQGLIVKRGAGELDLMAVGKVRQSSSNYDYYTNVEVVDGILKFPQADSDSARRYISVRSGISRSLCRQIRMKWRRVRSSIHPARLHGICRPLRIAAAFREVDMTGFGDLI